MGLVEGFGGLAWIGWDGSARVEDDPRLGGFGWVWGLGWGEGNGEAQGHKKTHTHAPYQPTTHTRTCDHIPPFSIPPPPERIPPAVRRLACGGAANNPLFSFSHSFADPLTHLTPPFSAPPAGPHPAVRRHVCGGAGLPWHRQQRRHPEAAALCRLG